MSRRAIVIRAHGGPEALQIETLPDLVPQPGHVRVRVTHVALNHLDLWVRRGVPGHDFHLPRIPGSDVAGVLIDAAGGPCLSPLATENPSAEPGYPRLASDFVGGSASATGIRPRFSGDSRGPLPVGTPVVLHPSWGCGVCPSCLTGEQDRCRDFLIRGESADGGCVTELSVPAWQVLPIPAGMSAADAASLPLTLLTAWHMLVTRAALRRGERVLVQAGASGVGVMAIQIARLFGCEVHATASTEARRERLRALGATAWAYDSVKLRDVDVVVESVGEATWATSIRCLARGGRLVCCGATTGADVRINLRPVFFKQLSVIGSTMGSPAELVRAWREVEAGAIRPVVDRVLPLSRLGEAHALLEARGAFGKVVLEQDLT